MTLVIVGGTLDVAESHRKHGLGSFEALKPDRLRGDAGRAAPAGLATVLWP